MRNFLISIILLIIFPLTIDAQQFGNFTIDENKRLYFEKVFEVPGMKAEEIQPLLISRLASERIFVEAAADKIITAKYVNFDMVVSSKKTKLLGRIDDGWRQFYGLIKIEIKDNKYRVQITNMKNYFANDYYTFEQLFNTKKPSKHIGKLLKNTDDYFVAFYTIGGNDDW